LPYAPKYRLRQEIFSTFKTACGRKTLLMKDDTRYIGVMEEGPESQKQAENPKIIAGLSLHIMASQSVALVSRMRKIVGAIPSRLGKNPRTN
jgi:hypothetical protein